MTAYFTIGDRLYEQALGAFLRDEWFASLSEGAQRAEVWVEVSKAEIALLEGLFVPWYLLLGMSAAKLALFYRENRAVCHLALSLAPSFVGLAAEMREKDPVLFNRLLGASAREAALDFPSGVSADDVAFWLGRVLRGSAGTPEATLGAVLKMAALFAGLVALSHGPSIAARGLGKASAHAVDQMAEQLRREAAARGVVISSAEATAIVEDARHDPGLRDRLERLASVAQQLSPVLEQLNAAYRGGEQ